MTTFGIIVRGLLLFLAMALVSLMWRAGSDEGHYSNEERADALQGSAVLLAGITLIQVVLLIGANA